MTTMIRAYLRASTDDQDANRARESLKAFGDQHDRRVAGYYVENASGATLARPELMRLIADCEAGDILLIEQVDRLSRLAESDWHTLRDTLKAKGILVVSLDLPTSHLAMTSVGKGDQFTGRMLGAISDMLLEMLAAIAHKDYEDRRRRQMQGIAKAQQAGLYKGKQVDTELRAKITELLNAGMSIRKVANMLDCSTTTVQRAKAAL